MTWVVRAVAAAAVLVVAWCSLTAWPAIVHGHPAYAVLLIATVIVAVAILVRQWRHPTSSHGWRLVGRVVLVILAVGWVATMAWLRPLAAVEPALAAMQSDPLVTVVESPTQIELIPTSGARSTGVQFQPGAKVDARAYAAILRPLAEAGYTVVIPKQPLGIAFLATGAFESARDAHPNITDWVVGGHSLGGTVAAMDAEAHDNDSTAPVTGLMLYASYPATDMSSTLTAPVLSVSGSNDGLATPEKIDASKSTLPAASDFVVIEGAVHAFFGDYGPQSGDGTPTISHDQARAEISATTLAWLRRHLN